MNKQPVLYGVIGLLSGVVIAWTAATVAVNGNHNGMMRVMGLHTSTSSQDTMNNNNGGMSMDQMVTALQDKTGDDFDKTFVSEMIMHHQGAIDMANLARTNAKHDEIKGMANDIIAAQTKEVDQMEAWQNQWGYITNNNGHSMMDN